MGMNMSIKQPSALKQGKVVQSEEPTLGVVTVLSALGTTPYILGIHAALPSVFASHLRLPPMVPTQEFCSLLIVGSFQAIGL